VDEYEAMMERHCSNPKLCFQMLVSNYFTCSMAQLLEDISLVVTLYGAVKVKFSRYRPEQALRDPKG
jgi:hypothetical protein